MIEQQERLQYLQVAEILSFKVGGLSVLMPLVWWGSLSA